MKFSLSTASLFPRRPETIFALAREAGFDGVELALTPDLMGRRASYWWELSKRYHLPVLSIHAPYFDRLLRVPSRRLEEAALELAAALEAPLVTFHVYWRQARHPERRRGRLEQLRDYQQHYQDRVVVAIENGARPHRPGEEVSPAEYLEMMCRFAEEGDLALTFDTCHAAAHGSGLLASYEALKGRVSNVHFGDIRPAWVPPGLSRLPRLEMYYRTHLVEHQLPGRGKLPLEEMVDRLRSDGYCGPITLEVSPLALGVWRRGEARKRLTGCLERYRA